jgi:hypothetical protein
MQATPPVPQAAFVSPVLHWPFSQQPEQLTVVQIQEPFWHSVPVGQATQATPPVPQC